MHLLNVKLYILASHFRHFDIQLLCWIGRLGNPTCKISNLAFLKD